MIKKGDYFKIHNQIYSTSNEDTTGRRPEYFIISKIEKQSKTIFLKKVDDISKDVRIHEIHNKFLYTIHYDGS